MKIEEKNISEEDFIKCPYCEKELKKIDNRHLRHDKKSLKELLIEFPDCKIITKEIYLKNIEQGKRKKIFICYFCKNEFEGSIFLQEPCSCKDCRKKGLYTPKEMEAKNKGKETNLKKYGCISPMQNKGIQEKSKQTSLKNWNVEHPMKSKVNQNKSKKTNLERRNVEFNFQCPITKEKIVKTNLEKRNVENVMQDKKIQEKQQQSTFNNLGVYHPLQNKDSLNKFEETNQRIYGHKCSLLNEEVKKKSDITNIKNWGEDIWSKSEKGKQILREKNLEKHFDRIMKEAKMLNFIIKDSEYKNALYEYNWLCLKCDKILKTSWNNIQQGYQCPTCYPRNSGTSFAEIEIFEFIESLNISDNILSGDRKIINPLELDIYIPDKNIAIEYNGLHHHSEKMKEKTIEKYHPYNAQTYHLYKTQKCEELNIQLIHIFEDEWMFKKEIVKSRLKQILGVNNGTRIHARECIIKEIEPSIKNEFLEKFHIQGPDASRIKLGAFHNEDLISIMTFSKGNISKGSKNIEGIWELNRFCSDFSFHVIGIAGKLLSHFKKNYDWNEIFSYADRRWSKGNLYHKLGFELIHKTDPNYWYIKNFRRIHRFSLRKRPDEPKDITEKTLRIKEGYEIIWDCGSLKFSLKNN